MKKIKLLTSLSTLPLLTGAIALVSTSCSTSKSIDSDYSITIKDVDNDTIVTQPGQITKFVLNYKGEEIEEAEENAITWSVEIISGFDGVDAMFLDKYINSSGSGYFYVSYVNTANWTTSSKTTLEATASTTEGGRVLAHKTFTLKRASETYYTPESCNLSLANTIQLIKNDNEELGKLPLKLREEKNPTTDISGVTWEINRSMSSSQLLNYVEISSSTLQLKSDAPAIARYGQILGYLTIKATTPNNTVLNFCTAVRIGDEGIEWTQYPGTDGILTYGNYVFVLKHASKIAEAVSFLQFDEAADTVTTGDARWLISLKKDGVGAAMAGLQWSSSASGYGTGVPIQLRMAANYETFMNISFYSGTVVLREPVVLANETLKIVATREIAISIVDEETFEKLQYLKD